MMASAPIVPACTLRLIGPIVSLVAIVAKAGASIEATKTTGVRRLKAEGTKNRNPFKLT
jgi:hypothetical protein